MSVPLPSAPSDSTLSDSTVPDRVRPGRPARALAPVPEPCQFGVVSRSGIAAEKFRAVFRNHAGGVAVITADDGTGPVGFTATSVVSLSLEPPLVSFTLAAASSSFRTLQRAPSVVINFLDEGQAELATRFATPGIDRFAEPVRWVQQPDGSPVLLDAPSVLRGPVERRIAIGDHQLVVLRSIHAEQRRTYAPLVHHAGAYGSVRTR